MGDQLWKENHRHFLPGHFSLCVTRSSRFDPIIWLPNYVFFSCWPHGLADQIHQMWSNSQPSWWPCFPWRSVASRSASISLFVVTGLDGRWGRPGPEGNGTNNKSICLNKGPLNLQRINRERKNKVSQASCKRCVQDNMFSPRQKNPARCTCLK